MHFGGLEDDREDSTAPHMTFRPRIGGHRQCGLAICTFHLGFSLWSFLRHLVAIRNSCAHHELMWDREFITKFSRPKRMGNFLSPRAFFNKTENGKLYNTLVMVSYLTTVITNNKSWTRDLVALMNRYPNIPQDRMGFVADWQELDIWQG